MAETSVIDMEAAPMQESSRHESPRQTLGTVQLVMPPEKEKAEPVEAVEADHDGPEFPDGTLQSLLETMKKSAVKVEKGPEPQEAEEKPAIEQPAVKQPAVEDSALPGWLISRAADYGITAEEAKGWESEKALSRHLDGLDRVVRHLTKPKEEPKPEAKEEDLWGGQKDDIHDGIVAAVEKLEKKYSKQIADLKEELGLISGHVAGELQAKNRSTFDKLLDGLEGYEEQLGKGAVEPGSDHWQSRAKLETAMRMQQEMYKQFGKEMTSQEAIKVAAPLLFGTAKEAEPARKAPPKDEKTGRFTPTNRPTARNEPAKDKGPKAAVDWLKGYVAEMSGDVHDED